MKIKNQVTCVELSQKMCELGFNQEGHYWWCIYIKSNEATLTTDDYCKSNPKDYTHYVAYTVAELGEMLPEWACTMKLPKEHNRKKWIATLHSKIETDSDTEANARAKMLIWLKENKLL